MTKRTVGYMLTLGRTRVAGKGGGGMGWGSMPCIYLMASKVHVVLLHHPLIFISFLLECSIAGPIFSKNMQLMPMELSEQEQNRFCTNSRTLAALGINRRVELHSLSHN